MRNALGFSVFLLSGAVAVMAAWQHPSLLAWLSALHNLFLALIYARRMPARVTNGTGLWLGLIAAFLPMPLMPDEIAVPMAILGLAGYGLVFWSLVALGQRFGIAPADRGLVTSGPYRLVRHPMYLGELLLRVALLTSSAAPAWEKVILVAVLLVIQVARILLEERIISGYGEYANAVRWRLLPGLF